MKTGFFNPTSNFKLIGGGVLLLIVVGLLAFGGWQLYKAGVGQANTKISEYERKIEELNKKQKEKEIIIRERIINNYHTKILERTKIEYVNRDIIRTIVPEQSKLSKGWVHAHNQSAKGQAIDPALAANPESSNTSDLDALLVVTENYNLSNRTADRLEALQKYIRDVGIPVTNETENTNRPN